MLVEKPLISATIVIRGAAPKQDGQRVHKIDRKSVLHLPENNRPAAVGFLRDTAGTGSNCPSVRKVHRYNCNDPGFAPECIP